MRKKDKLPKTQRALRRAIYEHAAKQVLEFRMGACPAIDSFQYYPHVYLGITYTEEERVRRTVNQCLAEFRSMFVPDKVRAAFWLGPLTYGPMQERRALALLLMREIT